MRMLIRPQVLASTMQRQNDWQDILVGSKSIQRHPQVPRGGHHDQKRGARAHDYKCSGDDLVGALRSPRSWAWGLANTYPLSLPALPNAQLRRVDLPNQMGTRHRPFHNQTSYVVGLQFVQLLWQVDRESPFARLGLTHGREQAKNLIEIPTL